MAHWQGHPGSGGEEDDIGDFFKNAIPDNEVSGAGGWLTGQDSDTIYVRPLQHLGDKNAITDSACTGSQDSRC